MPSANALLPKTLRSGPLGWSQGFPDEPSEFCVGVREMTEIVDARRPADQPTLSFVAGFGIEKAEFALRFDALGQNRQSEPPPEPENGANDGRRVAIGVDRPDEGFVDLDLVERERAQIRQRGITGAEIVHRDAYAERLQLPKRHQCAAEIADQRGLGDLQFERSEERRVG